MRNDRFFKVMYRLSVHGMETNNWHMLVMEYPFADSGPAACIIGPELLVVIHWRMDAISTALGKITSSAVRVCDFKTTEITPEQALEDHRSICRKCHQEMCFNAKYICDCGNPIFRGMEVVD